MSKTILKIKQNKRTPSVSLIQISALFLLLTSAITGANAADEKMSFFITSVGSGDGANLGGLEGADAHCTQLAEAEGITGKTWHAYLSTSGADAINARDRIGKGPWYNASGVMVAANIEQLHSKENKLTKINSVNEKGEVVNGRGDKPNRHDILTGSNLDGTAFTDKELSCGNWTRNDKAGHAQLGHHDRTGGGAHPKSWNSAHASRGCSQKNLIRTGGNGYFYCFAI